MIDLEARHLDEVRRIIAEHAPDVEVWVFGSRISGKAERFADLDLALTGPEALDWRRIEALKDAFAESDLPIQVDVVDLNAVSDGFRRVIENRHEILATPAAKTVEKK